MTRTYLTISLCALCILGGCASHTPLIPRIERALSADEAAHVARLADMIDEAGPQWAAHSAAVRERLGIGRIGVGRLPGGADAWATWHPRQTSIILAPRYWTGYFSDVGRAGLLVIEACHIMLEAEDDCDGAMYLWVRDWYAVHGYGATEGGE